MRNPHQPSRAHSCHSPCTTHPFLVRKAGSSTGSCPLALYSLTTFCLGQTEVSRHGGWHTACEQGMR